MMKKISFLLALVVMIWGNLLKAQYGPNDDLDGDGIINAIDLDDDNDGILDTVECPTISYNPVYHLFDSDPSTPTNTLRLYKNSNGLGSPYVCITNNCDTSPSGLLYFNTNITGSTENLAYDDGKFYMINSEGDLLYTSDIVNIPFSNLGNAQIGTGFKNLGYENGTFYHWKYESSTLRLYSSTDPVNNGWTLVGTIFNRPLTLTSGGITYELKDIAVNNNTFYFFYYYTDSGGQTMSPSNYSKIFYSENPLSSTASWTNYGSSYFGINVFNIAMGSEDILTVCDTDGDGIPDYLDLDSDGDGCPDAIEGDGNISQSQLDADGRIIGGVDANGIPTVVNGGQGVGSAQDDTVNSCPIPCTGPDSDGDGIPDMCDDDADNDGIPNCIENGFDGDPNTAFKSNGHATAFTNPSGGSAPTNQFMLTSGGDQSGQAWSYGKIDFAHSFKINMKVLLSGADGIAIVFHNSPLGTSASGIKGQGLGARGIANGIALELDTFPNSCDNDNNNGANCDPSYDHGSIRKTAGTATSGWERLTPTPDAQLGDGTVDDGLWHDVEVSWNAITRNLSYSFDGAEVTNFTFPTSGPNALETIFGSTTNVHFGFTGSTGAVGTNNSIGFNNPCEIPLYFDTDGDGIPDYLDLDSDNDGCPDALEGDGNISQSQLDADGRIIGGVDANGIPTYVNGGQGIGDSQNASVQSGCFCYKPAATSGTVLDTKHGISALGRAGADDPDNWPMVRKGAWTALESKEKGFVINRIPSTAQVEAIANPVEGMMVYDEEAHCLKIYTTTDGTTFSWQCFNTQACPN